MPQKTIFVLANSIKKQQRCVAGREIVRSPDETTFWGGWVRPVSTHDEGAISLNECRLQDSCIPEPLDVVAIPCDRCENCVCQPENWIITQNGQWEKKGKAGIQEAQNLIENPPSLWLQSGFNNDRVSGIYLSSLLFHQSLYLIRPNDFRFKVEINPRNGWKRVRGHFNYNGHYYDLSMTDPIIRQKYFPNLNAMPLGFIELNSPNNCFICVSLTPELNGIHYKIIANVFEP